MYETHHRFLLPERKKRVTAAGKIRNEDRCDLLLKGKEHSLTSTVNRAGPFVNRLSPGNSRSGARDRRLYMYYKRQGSRLYFPAP